MESEVRGGAMTYKSHYNIAVHGNLDSIALLTYKVHCNVIMAGTVRQPIDLKSLSSYIDRSVPEIRLPIEIKQVDGLTSMHRIAN